MQLRCLTAIAFGACASLAQAAGWVQYGESEHTTYYYEPGTVRAEAQRKRVWRLFEHKEAQHNGVQSGKALVEIDCRDWTYRYLRTTYYSGKMGKGKYLGGTREHRGDHIGPGTMIHHLAGVVCQSEGPKAAAAAPAPASAPVTPTAQKKDAAR